MGPFRTFVFFAAAALIVSPLRASAETCAFQEQNGQVVIEVEAEPPNGGWEKKTSVSGYKGSGFYEWEGSNHFGEPGNGTLTYKVKINNPGNYQFLWRSRIMTGTDAKEHNDSWLRMSGTPINGEFAIGQNKWIKVFMGVISRWTWQSRTDDSNKVIRQYFSAGTHTIQISGRSAGHAIDRFILFKYNDKPYLNGAEQPPHTPTSTQDSNLTNQSTSSCNGGGGTTTTTKPTTTTTKPTTTTTKPTTTTTKPTTTTTKPTTTTTKPTTTTTKPTTTTTSTTTTTLPVSTTTTTMAPDIPGDVNGDGDVTVRDALETLMAAIGGSECDLCLCDFNGDGQVTVDDGFAILFIAVGREVQDGLPPCI